MYSLRIKTEQIAEACQAYNFFDKSQGINKRKVEERKEERLNNF